MNIENFLQDLSTIIEVDTKELTEKFSLKNCSLWDSLAVVSTMGLLDNYFNLQVNGARLIQCETIEDLLTIIKNKSH